MELIDILKGAKGFLSHGEWSRCTYVRAAGKTEAKTEARPLLKNLDTFRGGVRTLLWVEEV